MLFVLALAAVIWGIGMAMGAPRRARWVLIGVLLAAVIGANLVLPEGQAIRVATGGSALPWLVLLGVAGLVLGYRAALRGLRRRHGAAQAAATPPAPQDGFRPVELDRYARHIMLREIGGTGQKRLKAARVLVVGAGGLGSPALLYLAAAGVGTIGVIDDDSVEGSNLQRQIIHADNRIGMPKVFSAQAAMEALNPFVTVRPYHRRLTAEIAPDLLADYDLVLDGTDNFDTRYLVNRAAVAAGKPLISGAITQWEGQVGLFHPAAGAPCYECVFPDRPALGLAPSCAEAGVVSPLPGVVGSIMALEAVKWITGAGRGLAGQLLVWDGLWSETRLIRTARRPDCACCGGTETPVAPDRAAAATA